MLSIFMIIKPTPQRPKTVFKHNNLTELNRLIINGPQNRPALSLIRTAELFKFPRR